jgi:CubicO group peptidase (beta-lactamase class C family)
LRIENVKWSLDKAGHAYAMAGLQIQAKDLAKIGQLIVQQGKWNGKQIVSQEWLELSMKSSQPFEAGCGLLWWLEKAPTAVYTAQGYLGQYLIIIPETQMVGVRQMRSDKKDSFEKFPRLLMELSQSYSQSIEETDDGNLKSR